MNLKEIANLWGQYQAWLKQEGITVDNIQTKIPAFIQKLQENPTNAQILQNAMKSPQGQQIMKMLNLTDEEISSLTNFSSNQNVNSNIRPIVTNNSMPLQNNNNHIGNLTANQLQQLMKRRR